MRNKPTTILMFIAGGAGMIFIITSNMHFGGILLCGIFYGYATGRLYKLESE